MIFSPLDQAAFDMAAFGMPSEYLYLLKAVSEKFLEDLMKGGSRQEDR